jgi:hypothetical protein
MESNSTSLVDKTQNYIKVEFSIDDNQNDLTNNNNMKWHLW